MNQPGWKLTQRRCMLVLSKGDQFGPTCNKAKVITRGALLCPSCDGPALAIRKAAA